MPFLTLQRRPRMYGLLWLDVAVLTLLVLATAEIAAVFI